MKTKIYYLCILCFISFQMIGQNITVLKDIYLGEQPSNPLNFNEFNNSLILQAESADPQSKIYISDGSENGTVILKEGLKDGRPNLGVEFNGKFYFPASFSNLGQELWVTDGTTNGTLLVKDIKNGNFAASLNEDTEMIEFQGKIFFTADDGANGRELWVSEGTEETTVLFKDIYAGSESSNIEHLTVFDGKLYFSAEDDSDRGKELWVTDGNTANTVMVKDIKPGNTGSNITDLIEYQGKLYFSADSQFGRELWVTEGTSATTNIVKDLNSGSDGSQPSDLIVFKEHLYFKAIVDDGFQIYQSNGTEAGTKFFKTIEANGSSINLKDGVALNGRYYFAAGPQFTSGNELWEIYEDEDEVVDKIKINKIKEIYEGQDAGVSDSKLTVYNNTIFFQGNDGTTGEELWKSDGTEEGTVLVADMNTENNFKPEYFNVLGDKLFFVAQNQTLGKELHFYGETIVDNGDRTLIPDSNFEIALRELGLDDSNTNNGYVLTADIENIGNLFIKNKGISSLDGIQDFTSLQHLNASENSLSSLDLSTIENLITLDVKTNNLSSLKINVGNLQELHLENNANLTCVDVDNLQVINSFVFNDDLGLHTKDNHTSFSENCATSNETTNIPDNAFEQYLIDEQLDDVLDNEVLTANINTLTSLNLSNLGIEDLTGIEGFEALQELILDGNTNLTFNLSNNTNLTKLSLNNMDLTEFESFNYSFLQELSINNNNLTSLDTNSLYQITHLDCSFNQISYLELFALGQLQELICNNNTIEELDFTNLEFTTKIIVNNNALEKLNIKVGTTSNIQEFNALENPALSCIDVNDVDYATTNFTNIDAQTSFYTNCEATATTYIPDDNFEQYLIDRGFDDNLDDYVLTSNIESVTQLFISNREIKSLRGIEDFVSLRDLNCSNNLIRFLDLQDIPSLSTLSVSNNNLYNLKLNVSNIIRLHIANNENLTCVDVDDINIANNFDFNNSADFSKDSQTSFSANCPSLLTYVPDDNFEQFLIDDGKDDVLDDYVLTANINQIEEFTMVARGIRDLTGIEDFEALVALDVSANLLTEVNITSNSNLETLNISSNQLTNLHTRPNLKLETVNAAFNQLTTVNLSPATKTLDLNTNKFTSLSLSNLVYLEELNCKSNTNLSELILTSTPSIKEIQASFCNLSSIDVSSRTVLVNLDISYNNITNLDLRTSLGLETVQCRNNEMETLLINSNRNSNKIKSLIARDNNLTSLDLSGADDLEGLNLYNNNLSSLNLKNGTGNLSKITSFTTLLNANLTCIDVDDLEYANENLTSIDDHTNFYYNCNFFGGDYVYMPDNNFESKFDDTIDDFVLKSIVENRETLFLSLSNTETNKIEDLTGIEAFINLKELSFSRNLIETVDLSANLLLEKVIAQNSGIKSVILPETTTLIDVDFYNNELTTFDVSSLTNIKRLLLTGNNITAIDVRNNTNLEEFQIGSNQMDNIDVSNNTKLKWLEVNFMGLTTLDISNNRLLENLGARNNDLSILDLTNNIRLTAFEARSNNLSCIKVWDVDFANANWSDNIDDTASFGDSCYTEITDANFEQALIDANFDNNLDGYILTSTANTIETLQLASLNIEDLSGIEDFTTLVTLNVDNNKLSSIDLTNNTQLNSLIISNNTDLDRLNISQNTNLTSLIATGNNFSCIQVWDVDYANANWNKGKDASAEFSLDCNDVWTVDVDEKTQTILDAVPGLDADGDGNITIAEAEAFTEDLDLSDKDLKDVEGLQAFSNVKKLNLSGNNIDDFSPLTRGKITLVSKTTGKKREVAAKSSGLETLIISNNTFETINLDELKDLIEVDLSNNPNLVTMSIKNGNNANITSFDATNAPNLTCILVDDKNANHLTNFKKDVTSNFVSDIADCRNTILSTKEFLQKDVNVFPNPVANFLTINSTKEFDFVEVYNSIGKKIIKTEKSEIDFSHFNSGIYMIRIIADNKVLTKKIIKN